MIILQQDLAHSINKKDKFCQPSFISKNISFVMIYIYNVVNNTFQCGFFQNVFFIDCYRYIFLLS